MRPRQGPGLTRRVELLEETTRGNARVRAAMRLLRREAMRWLAFLCELDGLLDRPNDYEGDDDPVTAFMRAAFMKELPERYGELARGVPGTRRRMEAARRVPAAALALFSNLPPELRPLAATKAALDLESSPDPWAAKLIYDATELRLRIPGDVEPAVIGAVATTLAARADVRDDPILICASCGVPRPQDGNTCPYCDAAEAVRRREVADGAYDWQRLWRQEIHPDLPQRRKPAGS